MYQRKPKFDEDTFPGAGHPTPLEAQRNPARAGEYMCNNCRTHFCYPGRGKLACPVCHNRNQSDLVALYIEEDAVDSEMLGASEFTAGD